MFLSPNYATCEATTKPKTKPREENAYIDLALKFARISNASQICLHILNCNT